jgi:hypothetical protein
LPEDKVRLMIEFTPDGSRKRAGAREDPAVGAVDPSQEEHRL